MGGDDAGEVRGHPGAADKDLDPGGLGVFDILDGLNGASMGGKDAEIVRDAECVEGFACFDDDFKVVGASREDRDEGAGHFFALLWCGGAREGSMSGV